jgi:hypothetical protein
MNFALITEGKTDQAIIENVLIGHLRIESSQVRPLQPLRDKTDTNKSFSNWYLVFEYCESKKFKEIFQYNDYVIIQIDTDVSEEIHYDVPKTSQGKELPVSELIEKVKERIVKSITDEVYDKYKEKILFAICVHSIECWLLPLYYLDNNASKTSNCLKRLNRARIKKSELLLTKHKDPKLYEDLSSPLRKRKKLQEISFKNPSFKIFIEELSRIKK